VSLNEGADSDSEAGGEDAAAEAAWAEMELKAENAEKGGGASSGAALGKALALVGPETQRKINRTLLRRRRKAANKDGKEPMDRTWAKKISGKPRRETMLPGMEVCICVCVYIYIYTYIYIYIYICMYVYIYICIYVYLYIHLHIYVYIYTYVACVRVCCCVCVGAICVPLLYIVLVLLLSAPAWKAVCG